MASAAVNTAVAAAESFLPQSPWLTSPRISFSHDDPITEPSQPFGADLEATAPDFEFRLVLEDPVAMLPADELFSDGKLVPLHLSSTSSTSAVVSKTKPEVESTLPKKQADIPSAVAVATASPRAPRCSSRWRELLGLRRLKPAVAQKSSSSDKSVPTSLKQLILNRSARSSNSIATVPLLQDSDSQSPSSTSSSSNLDPDDIIPRLSLDSDRKARNLRRVRVSRQRVPAAASAGESPRMNASGRVVFKGLERSSSSPAGSFYWANGPVRSRVRSVERSNSAHTVRVTPVLNVPVCSLRGSGSVFGLGQLFGSPQKKEQQQSASKSSGAGKCKNGEKAAEDSLSSSKVGKIPHHKGETNSAEK